MKKTIVTTALIIFIFSGIESVLAGPSFEFEGGMVYTGYNNIRIPGDFGTKLSLNGDINSNSTFYFRLRAGWNFFQRHTISFLIAPLTINADGFTSTPILFNGDIITAGGFVKVKYRFDAYRFTYRYDFISNETIVLGAGLTAMIRDASIRLGNDFLSSEKKNTGFVPLINLRLQWNFIQPFSFLFEADALWAPQGRAEDLLFALQLDVNSNLSVRVGYRLLEGGADNDNVYAFALFHYMIFGFTARY